MRFLDCYAIPRGEKGHIEGFPEVTCQIDVNDNQLNRAIAQLTPYFAEIHEVKETNGQAIEPLSAMTYYIDQASADGIIVGVRRPEGPGIVHRLPIVARDDIDFSGEDH